MLRARLVSVNCPLARACWREFGFSAAKRGSDASLVSYEEVLAATKLKMQKRRGPTS